jgi:hypothetical protein
MRKGPMPTQEELDVLNRLDKFRGESYQMGDSSILSQMFSKLKFFLGVE